MLLYVGEGVVWGRYDGVVGGGRYVGKVGGAAVLDLYTL